MMGPSAVSTFHGVIDVILLEARVGIKNLKKK